MAGHVAHRHFLAVAQHDAQTVAAKHRRQRRFGLEPWPARLLFVLILMLVPGSQLIVYPILWIVMPNEPVRAWAPQGPTPQGAYPQGGYPQA